MCKNVKFLIFSVKSQDMTLKLLQKLRWCLLARCSLVTHSTSLDTGTLNIFINPLHTFRPLGLDFGGPHQSLLVPLNTRIREYPKKAGIAYQLQQVGSCQLCDIDVFCQKFLIPEQRSEILTWTHLSHNFLNLEIFEKTCFIWC